MKMYHVVSCKRYLNKHEHSNDIGSDTVEPNVASCTMNDLVEVLGK